MYASISPSGDQPGEKTAWSPSVMRRWPLPSGRAAYRLPAPVLASSTPTNAISAFGSTGGCGVGVATTAGGGVGLEGRGPDGEDGPPALPPSDGKETAKKDDPKAPKLEEGTGVLVVLGDADLAADDFSGYRGYDRSGVLASMNGNAGFPLVMNLIDWMTGSEDLIALRSRGAKARHLDEIEDGTISAIEWANHLGVPLLVLLSGLVVFIVRRQRR